MTTADQTVDEIEREAAETRAKLGERLDSLQDRLAPSKNVGRALDYVKENSGEVANTVAGVVRNNPIPVLMIGAGLAWLMLSRNDKGADGLASAEDCDDRGGERSGQATVSRYGDRGIGDEANGASDRLGDEDGEHLSGGPETATGGVKSKVKHLGGKLRDGAASARDGATDTLDKVRAGAGQAKERSERFVSKYPLSIGIAGLAVGALVAASLPITRREEVLVGEKSDAVKRAARQAVAEKGEEIRSATAAVVKSAKEEAKKQGLNPVGSKAEKKQEAGGSSSSAAAKAEPSKNEPEKPQGGKKKTA